MLKNTKAKLPLLLIGGGGHCRSCIDVIEATGEFEIVGIVESDDYEPDLDSGSDSDFNPFSADALPYPVIGRDADLPELIQQTPHCVITIGQIKSAAIRIKMFSQLKQLGAIFPTIISPLAHVSASAKLGEGTIVMHQALVNAYAQIGDNCIINSQALVEHDCVVANHCHLSTAAKLNGEVHIGEACMIGSSSAVKQGVTIAENVVIGMGSVVLNNVEAAGVYKGLVK